jgi:Uma2 family endonuclease
MPPSTTVDIERRSAAERAWPPPQGQWTYEDWLRLPDDGWQYEVIKGVLYMTPAPNTDHQLVSRELLWHMLNFVKQHGLGELFNAPIDVYLPGQETPVEPDLAFIATARQEIISKRGIEDAPDLIVEILSPSNWWRDRRAKLPLYEETGVPECWIIDPDLQTVEVFVLRDQQYVLLGQWGQGEVVTSQALTGFQVAVDDIMPTANR